MKNTLPYLPICSVNICMIVFRSFFSELSCFYNVELSFKIYIYDRENFSSSYSIITRNFSDTVNLETFNNFCLIERLASDMLS